MSQNSFGRLGQIRHGLAVSTLFALTVFATLPPSVALAADAQPKKKDSIAFVKPKEVVLSASVEPAEAKAGDVVTYTVTAKVASRVAHLSIQAESEGRVRTGHLLRLL